jgi:hypothetical protein
MRNPWKLTTFFLIALLAVVFGSKTFNDASADPQPRMRDALGHLEAARTALQEATSDKGGHRAKAVSLTKQAIKQVEAGIRFDNRN